jgi:hypothetical protein
MKRRIWLFTLVCAALAASPALAVPSFTLESGDRVSDAVPGAITGSYATFLRLYFVRDFTVLSSSSTDGVTWVDDAGVRISSETPNASVAFSSVTSASVLELDGGGFRMLFSAKIPAGTFRIYSASSTDGLAWGVQASPFFSLAGVIVESVRLHEETDGTWRLFFVQGTSSATFRVFSAASTDEGVTWGSPVQVFDEEAHGVAPSMLTDGRIRLYYLAPLTNQTTATRLLSAIESTTGAGLTFNRESGVRLSTASGSGVFSAPLAFRDDETFRWRVYLAFQSTTTAALPNIVSAITASPDPQRLTPSSVARTLPAGGFAVTGEVFSPGATVKLTQSGQPDIPGTAVSVVDDQTISATFDTQNAALGTWDLVVTNSDLQSATLAGALTIDFEEGRVAALDNVFRPLRGQSVHFDVTVFNDGRVTAKLYTIDGRYIRTLFDNDVGIGTTSVDWDGRTADGNLAASGVYLVSFEGPRLELRKKVVVIK